MHTKRPPFLVASLLAIMFLGPLLMVDADDQTLDAKEITKQEATTLTLRSLDHQNQNFPSQQFIESRSSMQEYPRQLFRLHILDSRPRTIAKHRNVHHSSALDYNSTTGSNATKQSGSKLNKNISNATLKKLLNQAMQQQQNRLAILARNTTKTTSRPAATDSQSSSEIINSEQANFIIHNDGKSSQANRTTDNVYSEDSSQNVISKPSYIINSPSLKPGGSNFKFVFIQRAVATGNGNSNSTNIVTTPKQNKHVEPIAPATPSLAASISRQLANSLLYSAANFVSNLNITSQTSQSSLSDLKNQLTTKKGYHDETTNETETNDIQRLTTTSAKPEDRSDTKSVLVSTKRPPQITSSSSRPKYRKNSKIYNLPVKFVANGQPNGQIVIQTIKQHLAAMKRTGSAVLATSPDYGMVKHANRNQSDTASTSKNKNKQIKLKGVNSRLIYLPLRMLMNGKPSRISVLASRIANDEIKPTTKLSTTTTTKSPSTETESQ